MKYDDTLRPDFLDLGFEIKTRITPGEKIERSGEHAKQLAALYLEKNSKRALSPSAINTWLNCRMKFLYRYIYRLKEPENISVEIDPAMLGNILHEIMKAIYQPYSGTVLTGEKLKELIRNKEFLGSVVDKAVNEKYKAGRNDAISGDELIVRDVLMTYLLRILHSDKALAPLVIHNLEDSFSFSLKFNVNGSESEVITGGNIDRIDTMNGVTRIVDYKTGIVSEYINSIDELFADDRKKDSDAWLQTLLYSEAYLSKNQGIRLRPSVYKIKKLNADSISDKLRLKTGGRSEIIIEDYETIRPEFLSGLKGLAATIFNDNEPFVKTTDLRGKCSYCPYKTLCMR